MAPLPYIASAVFTGLVLLAIVLVVARDERWRQPTPRPEPTPAGESAAGTGVSPALVVALSAVGLAGVAGVFGVAGVEVVRDDPGFAMAAGMGGLVSVYLLWGVYHSIRVRGRSQAAAVAAGAWMLGVLFVVAVSVRLLLGG